VVPVRQLGNIGFSAEQRLVDVVGRGDAREAELLAAAAREHELCRGGVARVRRILEAKPREGAAVEAWAVREEISADISPPFLVAGNGDVALICAWPIRIPSSLLCFLTSEFH